MTMQAIVINDRVVYTSCEKKIAKYNAKCNEVARFLVDGAMKYGFTLEEAAEFVKIVRENVETVKRIISCENSMNVVTELNMDEVVECIHANKAEIEFFLMTI